MATESELLAALRRADAAGDAAAASAIARRIQSIRQPPEKSLGELEADLRGAVESGDPERHKAASIAYLEKQREDEGGGAFYGGASKQTAEDIATKESTLQYEANTMGGWDLLKRGAAENLKGKGRAIQQLLEDDPVKSLRLQEAEAVERAKNKYITGHPIAGLGALGVDTGLSIAPGSLVAKASRLAPAGAKLVTALLGEGAVGGGFGAVQPTAPGESREKNVTVGAALGTAIPVGGALLRAKPAQQVADKILDYTPLVYHKRMRQRNEVGRAAHEVEVEAARARNVERDAATLAEDVAAAEAINTTRAAQEQAAREQLAATAGWPRAPSDKVELDQLRAEQGREYGELIRPVQTDIAPVMDTARAASSAPGLSERAQRNLESYVARFESAGGRAGVMPGDLYKDIRSELTRDLRSADSSAERRQLEQLLTSLDSQFEAAIPAEVAADIARGRSQYALSSNLQKVGIDPVAGGWDLGAVQRRLDLGSGNQATREQLYAALRGLPERQRVPLRAAAPDREALPKFKPESSEYATMAGVQAGLLGAGTAMGVGPLLNFGLPAAAAVVKQAENERTRRLVSSLLRGTNISTQPMITPQERY